MVGPKAPEPTPRALGKACLLLEKGISLPGHREGPSVWRGCDDLWSPSSSSSSSWLLLHAAYYVPAAILSTLLILIQVILKQRL